jgi:uncharacterized protein YjiS (DUF1127 family)
MSAQLGFIISLRFHTDIDSPKPGRLKDETMTTTDYARMDKYARIDIAAADKPGRRGFVARLKAWLSARRAQQAGRLALIELSQLDAHLLRDIGINPADVQAALRRRRRSIWLHPWQDPR